MIAVIFEVQVAEGRQGEYLDIAAALKPKLSQISGFISVERFQSLTDPKRFCPFHISRRKRRLPNGVILTRTALRREKGEAEFLRAINYELPLSFVTTVCLIGLTSRVIHSLLILALPKKIRMNNVQSFLSP